MPTVHQRPAHVPTTRLRPELIADAVVASYIHAISARPRPGRAGSAVPRSPYPAGSAVPRSPYPVGSASPYPVGSATPRSPYLAVTERTPPPDRSCISAQP